MSLSQILSKVSTSGKLFHAVSKQSSIKPFPHPTLPPQSPGGEWEGRASVLSESVSAPPVSSHLDFNVVFMSVVD